MPQLYLKCDSWCCKEFQGGLIRRSVICKSASWSWSIVKLTYLKVICVRQVFTYLSCVLFSVCRTTAEGHSDQVVLQTGLLSPDGPGWKSGRDQRRQHQLLWADNLTRIHILKQWRSWWKWKNKWKTLNSTFNIFSNYKMIITGESCQSEHWIFKLLC